MSAKNWNDIDLGGLCMDSPADSPEGSYCHRQERISTEDVSAIVLEQNRTMNVAIQNLSSKKEFTGIILDISSTGAKLLCTGLCQEPDVVRISFKVGKRQIFCRAKVVWSKKKEEKFLAGVHFIAPNEADVDYIRSIVAAKHLR